MNRFKRMVSTVVTASVLAMIIPAATASAATTELRSSAHPGYCLDVYHGTAAVGSQVRLYPCAKTNKAEQAAINRDTHGKLHIYFRPTLCVGGSHGKAVLLRCTNSATNLTEKALSNGNNTFTFAAGVLTAPSPAAKNPYPQLTFTPANAGKAEQWKLIVL